MEVKVYGSAHCVTSLKAKQWLEHHQLPYQFVDLEERDLSTEAFHNIAIDLSCVEKKQLIFLCTQHTNLLRRPLIIIDEVLFIGYNEQLMEQLILNK